MVALQGVFCTFLQSHISAISSFCYICLLWMKIIFLKFITFFKEVLPYTEATANFMCSNWKLILRSQLLLFFFFRWQTSCGFVWKKKKLPVIFSQNSLAYIILFSNGSFSVSLMKQHKLMFNCENGEPFRTHVMELILDFYYRRSLHVMF